MIFAPGELSLTAVPGGQMSHFTSFCIHFATIPKMARVVKQLILFFCIINAAFLLAEENVQKEKVNKDFPAEEPTVNPQESPKTEADESEEIDEHAKGSVCSYCSYCKFCKLCDEECPCEKTKSKPNCHMCKYCKYCTLCSSICDTVCLPGGFLDTVSSSIWNSLPSFDTTLRESVDKDIDSVKDWIKEYL